VLPVLCVEAALESASELLRFIVGLSGSVVEALPPLPAVLSSLPLEVAVPPLLSVRCGLLESDAELVIAEVVFVALSGVDVFFATTGAWNVPYPNQPSS
jgi:hypothetical protein